MLKNVIFSSTLLIILSVTASAQNLYDPIPKGVHTRWVTPENSNGEKGKGVMTNQGAKGDAFYIIQPGETKTIFNVKGAGVIERIWSSGSILKKKEQRRALRIDMYWEDEEKPAVSAPIGDFFGIAHGLSLPFESDILMNPEGRSFNATMPMPFKKSARINITNESSQEVWMWFDINYLAMEKMDEDILYFHAYWNRDTKTKLAEDYVILPKVEGSGRYIGANIGVLGGLEYKGTWFGEGEVKMYLDGDSEFPTLVGTGTEDYIATGWGQGVFSTSYAGSVISDKENEIYAFYRYHLKDKVYFHKDKKVTIQQMGAGNKEKFLKPWIESGVELIPTNFIDKRSGKTEQGHLMYEGGAEFFMSEEFPAGGAKYYRRDDVCATAYFYLDKPTNNLPELPPLDLRLVKLKERVYNVLNPTTY
ncbi:MAG: DUF2961 domain-containing protein [Carboxylicivirga sp.]|jgi:hypothetical protein|nr:DUF2961 domain-containing protein [Carboxylicivirga sp.]